MSEHSSVPIVWRPTAAQVAEANVTRLMKKVGAGSFEELHAWSVADLGRFWDTALEDLGLSWYEPYTQTYDDTAGFPWT